jgi:cytochrome c-type biogenesis protein CcmF
MLVELGHFALILAFLVAIVQGVLPLAGRGPRREALQALARPSALFAVGC